MHWGILAAPAVSLVLVLAFMPAFLPFLKKLKFGQTIYDLGRWRIENSEQIF